MTGNTNGEAQSRRKQKVMMLFFLARHKLQYLSVRQRQIKNNNRDREGTTYRTVLWRYKTSNDHEEEEGKEEL